MRKLPCPRCGSPKTLGTFCTSCLRELSPLIANVRSGKLVFCASCERIQHQGTWSSAPLELILRKSLAHMLVGADQTSIRKIDFDTPEIERKPGIKRTITITARVRGSQDQVPEEYEEEYEIPLAYEVTLCSACKKRGSSYYEGILQIRHERPVIQKEIEAYLAAHRSHGLHLAKRIAVGSGADYYLSSNRAVGHLARKLHGTYGGTLKVNAQHFSEDKQKGKILYRTNALLEIPEYTKGDVIVRDGKHYFVTGVSGTVAAEEIPSGREIRFPYVPGEARVLAITQAQVAATHPIALLHPGTYEEITPLVSIYAPCEFEIGSMVSVAVDGDVLVLIPQTLDRPIAAKKRRRLSQKRKE